MLQSLCNQQAELLGNLEKQKDAILANFEAYKLEQEKALKDIKRKAAEQEAESEAMVEKSKELIGQLRWALQVQENLRVDNK